MFKNNFKIALRNLAKNKSSSIINISGLAVGMTVAILIGLWIWDELSFNQYHQNYARIGQVMARDTYKGVEYSNFALPYPLATELKTNYHSQFKQIIMASWVQDFVVSAGEKKISAQGQFMEDGAPEMFTLKMLHGTWGGLKDPNSILLSASTAKALYGKTDPLNQMMKINNKIDVKVTGVYEDLPRNSQFNELNFLSPWDLFVSQNDWILKTATTDWANHFLRIYVQIKPNENFDNITARIKDAEFRKLDNFKELASLHPQIFLQPMSRWHLYSQFKRGLRDTGPIHLIWLIGIIGSFVLLLACINFMNLSTARSENRAKEVGIRKTLGSRRSQLVNQFFSESFIVVFFSYSLAILLVSLSLPGFNSVANKALEMPWGNSWFWLMGFIFVFITGLLAGSYPAFYLSSFKPVKVLKGRFRLGRFATLPRKVLVVLQFTVSTVLIIGTIVVYRQIQYAKDRPVGYSRDGLIMIEMKSPDFYGKYDLLRTAFKNTGIVAEMSESMGPVTSVVSGNGGFDWKGKDPSHDKSFGTLTVTPEFGKTVGWQFVQGRDFSRTLLTDSMGVVINEAAAKYMGLDNPVGEIISWKFNDQPTRYYNILGVTKDMVMESPYEPIAASLFFLKAPNGDVSWIDIKISPNVGMSQALQKIEAVFKKLIPSAPFDYKFADQEYALKFVSEERIGRLAYIFALLAIFISCLGLFGLASFVAEQRTKEIGVRKVLGASVLNVWGLLSKDFASLVFISLIIATPVAYYSMNLWLQNYQYRAEMAWWIFLGAGLGALLITLLTVSFQAIKAALTNPVISLRSE